MSPSNQSKRWMLTGMEPKQCQTRTGINVLENLRFAGIPNNPNANE